LIKRLGLKLDAAFLEDEERRLVEQTTAGLREHGQSWLMFTPTELLKQYVKEAFNREDIAASGLRIQTWNDYRRELAHNQLGVLRTATGTGSFVLKDTLASLQTSSLSVRRSGSSNSQAGRAKLSGRNYGSMPRSWPKMRTKQSRALENGWRKRLTPRQATPQSHASLPSPRSVR
jgi:hypothetical protein